MHSAGPNMMMVVMMMAMIMVMAMVMVTEQLLKFTKVFLATHDAVEVGCPHMFLGFPHETCMCTH